MRQAVRTNRCVSESMSLLCSVSQALVLGPLVLSIYSELICDIAHEHDRKVHSYAHDTQLYLSFDVSDDMSDYVRQIEECVAEIREWMRKNMPPPTFH